MRQYKTVPVSFPNMGGDRLSGRLELPVEGKPTHFGIFAHCFTCGKDFFAPSKVSKALAAHGVAMLRFDFTGLGESKGSFADSTFSTSLGDILSAAKFLRNNYAAPSLLVGHSMGGAAALAASSDLDDIEAVAVIGSPCDPAHVLRHFKDHEQMIERAGAIELNVAGREYVLKKSFFDDLDNHDVEQDTRNFGGAVFVFHAPDDDMVSFKKAETIYERFGTGFLIRMEGASHMLDQREDAAKIADILAGWLQEGKQPDAKTA